MFMFYLRQTVPFTLSDLPSIFCCFFNHSPRLVARTESQLAKEVGVKYAVLCDSMRAGLQLSLEYFSKKNPYRNTILLPEYSFHSNLSAVLNLGLKVVFVPVDPKTLEIDPDMLEKCIDGRTLGVILTHVHGLVYSMKRIKPIIQKHKVILFEDCAHVFGISHEGRRVGSGGVGCFSFGAGKNVTSFGGGLITTNDRQLYQYLKSRQAVVVRGLHNMLILLKTVLYTFISTPFISAFTMKPILGLLLLINKRSVEENNFIVDRKPLAAMKNLSAFQIELLNYQLHHMRSQIQKIIKKRLRLAHVYDSLFPTMYQVTKNNTFFFQYPIRIKNPQKFIVDSWRLDFDVQQDYCSYLPLLMRQKKLSDTLTSPCVYLPTNQYLTEDLIRKIIPQLIQGQI